MNKKQARAYSNYTKAAALALASLIKLSRKEKKWTEKELAERAGISRATLQKIEKGDLRCEIGLVFELATLVGVTLFRAEGASFTGGELIQAKLALLPEKIRKPKPGVNDDF